MGLIKRGRREGVPGTGYQGLQVDCKGLQVDMTEDKSGYSLNRHFLSPGSVSGPVLGGSGDTVLTTAALALPSGG